MQDFLKIKGHSPLRCSDGTEAAQLQAQSWDAAQKFTVQSSVIASDPTGSGPWKRLQKYVEFNTCDFLGLHFFLTKHACSPFGSYKMFLKLNTQKNQLIVNMVK